MNAPIIMTEEYWANSQFSVVRYTGGMNYMGVHYVIVNKEGKDIYECSREAEKEGRAKAIEPGEPCDLIDDRYKPIYRKVGRDKFIEMVKAGLELKEMKEQVNEKPKESTQEVYDNLSFRERLMLRMISLDLASRGQTSEDDVKKAIAEMKEQVKTK